MAGSYRHGAHSLHGCSMCTGLGTAKNTHLCLEALGSSTDYATYSVPKFLGTSHAVSVKWNHIFVYFARGSQGQCADHGGKPSLAAVDGGSLPGRDSRRLSHVSGMFICYQHIILLKSAKCLF